MATLIDDILGVLGQYGAKYNGSTFQESTGNKFTLLDTPRLWDQVAPVPLPPRDGECAVAACEELIDAIWFTEGMATHLLDITLLWETNRGLPGGAFQTALNQAFWGLNGRTDANPLVRIIIGVPTPVIVRREDIVDWLTTTIELGGRQKVSDVKYPIQVARTHTGFGSWNHSKIVAANGTRAVVGGHNQWAIPYLGRDPVHDVSGLIQGPAAMSAHRFCDKLWSMPWNEVVLLKDGKFSFVDKGLSYFPVAPSSEYGTTRMLALGRLGSGIADEFSIGTNASVCGRLIALCKATTVIRISQQSLMFPVGGGSFDYCTLLAIVRAIRAGVRVEIVVSNEVPLGGGGYRGYLHETVEYLKEMYIGDRLGTLVPLNFLPAARDDFGAWAKASLNQPSSLLMSRRPTPNEAQVCLSELNQRLHVAPLYYAAERNYWDVDNEKKLADNHAKVYIVDGTNFYVGSDNAYYSGSSKGLQEFGYLIEGGAETQAMIDQYWTKIWKNSSSHVLKAT
jgi:phosphatidylserine/phosphatidylglycerophosphate/cardiolipin synthase-like enzyme